MYSFLFFYNKKNVCPRHLHIYTFETKCDICTRSCLFFLRKIYVPAPLTYIHIWEQMWYIHICSCETWLVHVWHDSSSCDMYSFMCDMNHVTHGVPYTGVPYIVCLSWKCMHTYQMRHVTHDRVMSNESCHKRKGHVERVMSKESCHTCKSHLSIHFCLVGIVCAHIKYEWVVSHKNVWMSDVTQERMDESCHTWSSYCVSTVCRYHFCSINGARMHAYTFSRALLGICKRSRLDSLSS